MPRVIQPSGPTEPDTEPEENQKPAQPQPTVFISDQNPQDTAQQQVGGNLEQNPVGMSANSLELKTSDGTNWPKVFKKMLPVIVVVLVAGGGWLFYKSYFSGLGTNTISNGGYTYSVELFKPSGQVRLNDGSEDLKHSDTVLILKPSDSSKLNNCSQIGNGWTEAFKVSIYDQSVPVCQPSSVGNYTTYFTALDQRHLFSITFKETPSEEVYPDLKTIFESVTVSEQ